MRKIKRNHNKIILALIIVAVLGWSFFIGINDVLAIETSALWGENGELLDLNSPNNWLSDFSYAGYHAGEIPIPNIPVVTNVKADYGAKGDGITDDTLAFKTALASMPEGALLIPKGKYIINEPLTLTRSGIVLRGEGRGESDTVLYFPIGLQEYSKLPFGSGWEDGKGGMIWVGHSNFTEPSDPGNVKSYLLATVISEAERGDKIIKVDDISQISAGQYVVIHVKDNSVTRTFATYLNNNYQNAASLNESAPSVARYLYWPVKVASVDSVNEEITLQQPLNFRLSLEWNPKIWFYTPAAEEIGIENLRIDFPDLPKVDYESHVNYNGIAFRNVLNSWARNVTIKNYDEGIDIMASKHCTFKDVNLLTRSDVNLYPVPSKGNNLITAHHGFTFNWQAADNLLSDFFVEGIAAHEVTLVSLANGNVIRKGTGKDMSLDGHRAVPFSNLFTANNLGFGNYPYTSSGGPTAGTAYLGIYNVFWGNNALGWNPNYTQPKATSAYGDIKTVFVPSTISRTSSDLGWNEKLNDAITPSDIYKVQVLKRLGTCYACFDNFALADINSDGSVNSQDITLCVNVILGIETGPAIVARAKAVTAPLDSCGAPDLQAIVNEILAL